MSFEQAMKRPKNYFKLGSGEQWFIDKELGILDWDGRMTKEQEDQMYEHFNLKRRRREDPIVQG
ncbi:hypothetical protein EVB97_076 [Rhizobium phage RHph_Y65]|uniref:Uncharacterized protein n=1 Tax=Rhizobium phage RHph_Y65 TaxID=2509785 RepID=A0A7S5RGW7_9CAUD|nr:hypothetical protein PQC17_gp076 [Rhizobium phage RHph_Y65]QIG72634.1 hypothetical protein EVB97_076 [Rhizobium phage RHph_Y65]